MMIDMHTHILPGIDDGAKDWDMTLEMLKRSAEGGVKKIIATPHYIPWKKKIAPEKISELCHETEKKLLNKYGIVMDIHPGNEIYYNLDVIQNLREGNIHTLAGSRYVLVEFTMKASYQLFCKAVREFTDGGYIPILAHVERYGCLHSFARLQELRRMGALIQMNVEAFQGGLFTPGSGWSKKCLSRQLVDFLGTDMHDLAKRAPLREKDLSWIKKRLDAEYQKKLLYGNAQKVLDNIKI